MGIEIARRKGDAERMWLAWRSTVSTAARGCSSGPTACRCLPKSW